jgi:crotonobetainyl-CoA:carnitine CoA-transferase CaiB-like acyl-CoA transferase
MRDAPLKGVRVVDLSRVLAGPLSAQVLGDLGADVIKIEHPDRGDDTRDWGIRVGKTETTYYYAFNRNKQSVAIDLGTEEGIADVKALIAEADVVVENFKLGGMEKFGLGYEDLRRINPRLVYCSISGYDRSTGEANRSGYDLVVQAESGLMAINGEANQPPLKFGVAVVDMFTGMYAAQGILAALFDAQRTGEGRRIDLALYDCGVSLTAYYGLDSLVMQSDPPRYGNAHPSVIPYGVFQAADGPIVIAVGNNRQFRQFCTDVLKRPDLAQDPRFQTNLLRAENRAALMRELDAELRKTSRAYLTGALTAAGVPTGAVLGLYEALSHPRTSEAGLLVEGANAEGERVRFMAPPWRLDGQRCSVTPPPTLGEHTVEVRERIARGRKA